MPFTIDMPGSARRHLEAAEALPEVRFDIAGYLYGLAAECAVKAMLLELGLRPRTQDQCREDPFYQHFPALLISSRDAASGRRSGSLNRVLSRSDFMAGWSIEMRYAATGEISVASVKRWAAHAKQSVGSIGT